MEKILPALTGVILLIILSAYILNKETVVVEPLPDTSYALPCQMAYGDEITDAADGSIINVSINVGGASAADEALKKTRDNIGRLNALYDAQTQDRYTSQNHWLGWSNRLFVKHRTEKEKYSRDGWYILALDNEGTVQGSFFISDAGLLMPATQTCSKIGCCV